MVGGLRFLVDTNVWLELLLGQEKAIEVQAFFHRAEASLLAITEFSLYSIGIILTRLKKDDLFLDFLNDTIKESGVSLIRLDIQGLIHILSIRKQFNLDFDDAYQYVAGSKFNYELVSFDSDFDSTEKGRKTPFEALTLIK
jgi:hypothetical protein